MKTKICYTLTICLALFFSSCKKDTPAPDQDTSCPSCYWQPDDLSTTTWCIYQYKLDDGSSTLFPLSDTLVFTSNKNYTYNGNSFTYSLDKSAYSYMLQLNDTPFGIINGCPALQFKTYGTIIGVPFSTVTTSSSSQTYYLWAQKI